VFQNSTISSKQFPKILENQELLINVSKYDSVQSKLLEYFDFISYSRNLKSNQFGRLVLYCDTITSTQSYLNQ